LELETPGQHTFRTLALDSLYVQVYALGMQIVWDRTKARQR